MTTYAGPILLALDGYYEWKRAFLTSASALGYSAYYMTRAYVDPTLPEFLSDEQRAHIRQSAEAAEPPVDGDNKSMDQLEYARGQRQQRVRDRVLEYAVLECESMGQRVAQRAARYHLAAIHADVQSALGHCVMDPFELWSALRRQVQATNRDLFLLHAHVADVTLDGLWHVPTTFLRDFDAAAQPFTELLLAPDAELQTLIDANDDAKVLLDEYQAQLKEKVLSTLLAHACAPHMSPLFQAWQLQVGGWDHAFLKRRAIEYLRSLPSSAVLLPPSDAATVARHAIHSAPPPMTATSETETPTAGSSKRKAAPQDAPLTSTKKRKAAQKAKCKAETTAMCKYCFERGHATIACSNLRDDYIHDAVRDDFELRSDYGCAHCKSRGIRSVHRQDHCAIYQRVAHMNQPPLVELDVATNLPLVR
ncbi:hypothetical protein SPRG_04869 [Saprolegnia parasitica CBS 223.65]|uniref:Uncharacterized protein n=1 Tax=Saprolegnia parasitica (strain CBS 223.65) TaxID=695850 RepID=A0A067CSJ2_SAPPC|nr:hypothetical protein SPRG_04869 [Saprolegnia parasitica CBS 223.65]KDO29752.1 hypothetical protein SPRG_04869 [Saprolegnia parasitica CBS 223.65]|eukprot:XP_012199400.1 hypothetical protein SPRG_04869 [Saprolegnia parasitica CBS 223.65]